MENVRAQAAAAPLSSPWRRWGRRALYLLLLLLLSGLAVGLYAYRSAGGVPDWYAPVEHEGAVDEARAAEDKIAEVQTWAASKHAWETASQRGTPLAPRPANELVVSFTQSEVNSFLAKWYAQYAAQPINGGRLMDVFQRPAVRIDEGKITLAGTMPTLGGRVVSLDLRPIVGENGLELQVVRVRSGNLALPDFTWARLRQSIKDWLQGMWLRDAPSATFDRGGAATASTAVATMAMQAVHSLAGEMTENVLFLPANERGALPVRLRRCELDDGMIKLVTEPLNAEQRERVLHRLRGGGGGDSGSAIPIHLTP